MPRRGGDQEEVDELAPANDNAMLAQIMEKMGSMRVEFNTRMEVLEARSRPPTPVLPAAPSEPPTPQITETTPPEADKRWRPEEVGYFDGTGDVFAFTDRLRTERKDATAYIQDIMRITKGLKWAQKDGFMTAFHHFEADPQRDLDPPEQGDLTEFINQVQMRQSAWYSVYSSFGKSRLPDPHPPPRSGQMRPQPYQQYRQQPQQQPHYQPQHDRPPRPSYPPRPAAYWPSGHTPRRYGNTHDGGGTEAMANGPLQAKTTGATMRDARITTEAISLSMDQPYQIGFDSAIPRTMRHSTAFMDSDLVICSIGYRDGDDCADRADPGPWTARPSTVESQRG
ncbi:hypothetical protein BDR22DRAFT_824545 [Usnea florida]